MGRRAAGAGGWPWPDGLAAAREGTGGCLDDGWRDGVGSGLPAASGGEEREAAGEEEQGGWLGDEEPWPVLGEELDFVREFLEIQEARFPDRLDYTFDVDSDCREVMVPGLILQPLVENALEHGIGESGGSSSWFRIHVR